MYKLSYFKTYELLPKEIYLILNNEAIQFFDENILRAIDIFREIYGTTMINSWFWNGVCNYSGLRPFNCEIGVEHSLHKFGRAMDLHHNKINEIKNRLINVIKNKETGTEEEYRFLSLITTIEKNTNGWMHIDTRNLSNINEKALIFNKYLRKYFYLF